MKVDQLQCLPIIVATKDNIKQTQFALDVKQKVLPLYEQLFDVEYPLPKLDTLVVSTSALPDNSSLFNSTIQANDFDAG